MAQLQMEKKFKTELAQDLAELQHVRDEIRLKLHLAGMDARSSWQSLEKKLELLEEKFGYGGDHVAESTRQLAAELKESFREFKKRLI
jgi:hypothetical protein